jgi:hypothetical protein
MMVEHFTQRSPYDLVVVGDEESQHDGLPSTRIEGFLLGRWFAPAITGTPSE